MLLGVILLTMMAPPPSDLSGYWTNFSITGLQRPTGLRSVTISDERAAKIEREENDPLPQAQQQVGQADVGARESEWMLAPSRLARIAGKARTSWLTDPPDGQLPYSAAGRAALAQARDAFDHAFDNPEERPTDEQCLLGSGTPAGPPLNNPPFNPFYEIVETPGAVAIIAEMDHDVRLIRMGDRPGPHLAITPWMGNSVGHWEGGTLVVVTTGLNPKEARHGGEAMLSPRAEITERFTRTSPETISYRFSVSDPTYYTRTWSGEMPLKRVAGPLLEYACHEGDRSLAGALAGARRAEGASAGDALTVVTTSVR